MARTVFLTLASIPWLVSTGLAQNCEPGVLACTPLDAMGQIGEYGDAVTDLAFRTTTDGKKEVWAIEGPLGSFNGLTRSRFTVYEEDLRSGRRSLGAGFPEPAFGICEVPAGHPLAGNLLLLSPDFDAATAGRQPGIGVMDTNGNLIAGGEFRAVIDPVNGATPQGFLSAIDIHPGGEELVLLDDGAAGGGVHILFVNSLLEIVRGPFPVEGFPVFFAGGVTYTSDSRLLVLGQFRHAFESRLALEYDLAGVFQERVVRLDVIGNLDPTIGLGIEAGSVAGDPALFFYDARTDAGYAIPLEASSFLDASGPVVGLLPDCIPEADGRVRLSWTNNALYRYDAIAVLENGVLVEVLPATATDYVTPNPVAGRYEFCLETRVGGAANEVRYCCEGQGGAPIPFHDPAQSPGNRVDIDPLPTNPHFQIGVACPAVVDKKEDFRLYVIGSFDNQVRVADHNRQLIPAETIITDPPRLSVLRGNVIVDTAASGIALLEVEVEGQKAPMYALLDSDGPGNLVPRGSVHFLKPTSIPGEPAPRPAGAQFGPEMAIPVGDQGGRFLVDWDADANGDLITLDSEARSVLRIRFDPQAATFAIISEAPLPMAGLTPFVGRNFPTGGISVLPNGNYLIAGGDTFDTTVTRVFLTTPFVGDDPANPDPARSVKMVGYVDGLLVFSQFFPIDIFGRSVGPDLSSGLETVFFRGEGAEGVGAMYYNFPHYFPTRARGFQGNFLVSWTSRAAHPDLVAEPLADEQTAFQGAGNYESLALTPSFAAQAPALDFHYHLFNASTQGEMRLNLRILLDGQAVPGLTESGLVLPPGGSLYRRLEARTEKSTQVLAESVGAEPTTLRVLVGATGLRTLQPAPEFRRGDVNDDGRVDVSDAVTLLGFQFLGGAKPVCLDAADSDDTGKIDISDAIYILGALFLGGAPIPPPGQTDCGVDPVLDELEPCASARC